MSAGNQAPRNVVLVGDSARRLADLPEANVDCVVTSPPYFNLRDYGKPGQIGLEAHVDGWVDALLPVMRGVARVLKPSGVLWLNLGDSYSRHDGYGAAPKSLLLAPERLLLALSNDGWIVRNRVAWVKPNSLPSSVQDRLTCSWEVIYMLTRSPRYHFDLDAIRIPHRTTLRGKSRRGLVGYPPATAAPPSWGGPLAASHLGLDRLKAGGMVGHPLGKNPGDAWTIPVSNFRGEHFATFPEALVERPILATCPERTCKACGKPWRRERNRQALGALRPACRCKKGSRPGLVLDPFFGSGTVALVAERHGRDWLGIELNPAFARIAHQRIQDARTRRTSAARPPGNGRGATKAAAQ
jgi:DNA modification methylase